MKPSRDVRRSAIVGTTSAVHLSPVEWEARRNTGGRHGMDTYIDLYLKERIARGDYAPATVPVVRSVLRRFSRHVNGSLDDLSELDVTTWLDCGLTPNTRKSMLTKLRPFIQWLVKNRVIPYDITADIRVRVFSEQAPRDLAGPAIERLFAALPDARAKLIVVLMLQLGLRCGGVAAIQVGDIDQRRRTLAVRGKGGRGEVTAHVPIPDEAWSVLLAHLAIRGTISGPLIVGRTGPRYRGLTAHTISKYVAGWLRDAGLKEMPHDGVSAHALRHTAAQDMLDSGATIREVQKALTHKSLRTTEIYLRRDPPGLREAMEGRSYLRKTAGPALVAG